MPVLSGLSCDRFLTLSVKYDFRAADFYDTTGINGNVAADFQGIVS